MRKKILSLILCVMMVVTMLPTGTMAEGTAECDHEWEAKYDGEWHWEACKKCPATRNVEKHSFEYKSDEDNHWQECECGAKTEAVAHSFTTANSDESEHWMECECGAKSEVAAHNFTIANSDETNHWMECACGAKSGVTAHSFTIVKSDGTNHWLECECGAKTEAVEHSFTIVKSDETTHWQECECGAKTEAVEHSFTTANSDESEHWQECECGAKSEVAAHNFTIANSDETNHWMECICGAKSGVTAHNFTIEKSDETTHWQECECGAKTEAVEHSFTIVKFDEDNHWLECECGAIAETTKHTLVYGYDANGHWLKCECGYEAEVKAHTYENGVCTECGYECLHTDTTQKNNATEHWEVCAACGEELNTAAHTYENGVCTECGYECLHTDTEPTYDANGHWNQCVCGEKLDYRVHDFDENGACTCGYQCGHTKTIVQRDESGHWDYCEDCEAVLNFEEHTFVNGICTECWYVCQHQSSGGYQSDESYHWRVCDVCGEIYGKETHDIDESTEECTVCGKVGQKAKHIIKLMDTSGNLIYSYVEGTVNAETGVVTEKVYYNGDSFNMTGITQGKAISNQSVQSRFKAYRHYNVASKEAVNLKATFTGEDITTIIYLNVKNCIQEIVYEWNEDYTTCTAHCECAYDDCPYTDPETETVHAEISITATCTQAGEKYATAKFTNSKYTQRTVDLGTVEALGHDWEDHYTIDKAATRTSTGEKSIHCSRCEERKNITDVHYETFSDVKYNTWYYEYVEYCAENGLMNGIGNGKFAPEDSCTRAMLVTVLYRMAGSPSVSGKHTFKDVQKGSWYEKAVIWALSQGIVIGYSSTKFGPDDPITREQMVTMLYRYAKTLGYRLYGTPNLSTYKDASKVSSWAKEAFAWCSMQGIIQGSDGKLLPGENATRAQVAKILAVFNELNQ